MDMRRDLRPLIGADEARASSGGHRPDPGAAGGPAGPAAPAPAASESVVPLQTGPDQAMDDQMGDDQTGDGGTGDGGTGDGGAGGDRPVADGAQAAWQRVRGRMRREIGAEAFASWLNPMVLHSAEAGEILLALPSRFMRDWVASHYAERLKALWQVEWPATRTIAIRVQPRAASAAAPPRAGAPGAGQPSSAASGPGLRLPLPAGRGGANRPAATRPAVKAKSLGQTAPRVIALARPPQGPGAAASGGGADRKAGPDDQAAPDAGMPGHDRPGAAVATGGAIGGGPPRRAAAAVPRGDGGEAYGGFGQGMFGINQCGALDQRNTFDTFIVGRSNELAHAAARRVAEAERDRVPFNPLFLYGGVGLGKTHLMHAIAWHIRQRDPDRRVMYLSAETFMYQFVSALRYKDTMAFKQQFRSVDVLMIDDVQFIAGKDSTQEEFFHTFNALCDQNRQIVISGDRSPADLEGMEERMRSRLGWGLVADIHPTDYELRLSILQSKVDQIDIDVPRNVLEFLAHRITANIRELEGALNRVAAFASLVGRSVELEMAQEVLRDLLRASDRRVTIEEIQKRVAEHYNIKLSEMHSPRRAIAVARPRQIAMYLAKQLTTRSLPEIGRKFGNRDHTTVMHAVKRIEQLQGQDNDLAEDIVLLRRILAS